MFPSTWDWELRLACESMGRFGKASDITNEFLRVRAIVFHLPRSYSFLSAGGAIGSNASKNFLCICAYRDDKCLMHRRRGWNYFTKQTTETLHELKDICPNSYLCIKSQDHLGMGGFRATVPGKPATSGPQPCF